MRDIWEEAVIEETGLPYDPENYRVEEDRERNDFVLIHKHTGERTFVSNLCPSCKQKMFMNEKTNELYCARCDT